MSRKIRIGTRTSRLALAQSDLVRARLTENRPSAEIELVSYSTVGDRTLDQPLPAIGGKGLFTAELEESLFRADIDLAVHSLKDLPVVQRAGLAIGATVQREDAHDCLVAKHGWTLDTLPRGAVIGTSSPRRRAQLLAFRPDFRIVSIRGNVETRIRQALEGDCDAVVLAGAGLRRLDLTAVVTQVMPFDIMLPAPGQGALGVQCRADDEQLLAWLATINDTQTKIETEAERRFLERLGGGCSSPVGAIATHLENGQCELHVFAEYVSGPGAESCDELPNICQFRAKDRGSDLTAICDSLAEQATQYFAGLRSTKVTSQSDVAPLRARLSLEGRRIVVTRPEHQAQELVDALESRGATTLRIPAIEIVPQAGTHDAHVIDQVFSGLSAYTWIVFTSGNAVRMFTAEMERAGIAPAMLHSINIAAVGPSTERTLKRAGMPCRFVPDVHTGSDLARQLDVSPGDTVLLPRSVVADDDVPSILESRGAQVTDLPLYDTACATLTDQAIGDLAQGIDIVTFASGSAVECFTAETAKYPQLIPILEQCTMACIGPKTANALVESGFTAHVVAENHTVEGLVDAIVSSFQQAEHEI